MSDNELMEMIIILLKMGTDTYEKCKYSLLAYEEQYKSEDTMEFLRTLFRLTDKRRIKLLEMK